MISPAQKQHAIQGRRTEN